MDKELNEAVEILNKMKRTYDIQAPDVNVRNRAREKVKAIEIVLNYIENSIPKKKIEDKIEELNKNIDLSIDNSKGGLDEDFIDKGIELLAKKRILQELLEEK